MCHSSVGLYMNTHFTHQTAEWISQCQSNPFVWGHKLEKLPHWGQWRPINGWELSLAWAHFHYLTSFWGITLKSSEKEYTFQRCSLYMLGSSFSSNILIHWMYLYFWQFLICMLKSDFRNIRVGYTKFRPSVLAYICIRSNVKSTGLRSVMLLTLSPSLA